MKNLNCEVLELDIEEAIKILDNFTTEHKLFNIKHSDGLEEAIKILLTAYEKEKENQGNCVSKDKIKPIQIIDLDGKIHNVYKIEEE